MSNVVQQLADALESLEPEQRQEITKLINQTSAARKIWVPNPGPQTAAYYCEADELFYGGQAGGGKSDLACGLAIEEHTRSVILRRITDDARDLADRFQAIMGHSRGFNNQLLRYKSGNKLVQFGGVQHEKDKERFKGKPFDLFVFDEIGDFLYTVYSMIIAWNRSAVPGQRCRTVATGNPPTHAEGLWVIDYWGPWLDPNHPNPAMDGELRWYIRDAQDRSIEVDGPGEYDIGEPQPVFAKSRTFIRAKLEDNPDLQASGYDKTLSALPVEYRKAYRDGDFTVGLQDNIGQLISTNWVRQAQERWEPRPLKGIPQCSIAGDVAEGGPDNNTIVRRHDYWFSEIEVIPGSETSLNAPDISGKIFAHRKDDSVVIIDCGGGYGGRVVSHLRENGVETVAFKGGEASSAKTNDDAKLGFANKRTEIFWRLREALDPTQEGGSNIQLPNDPLLLAELTDIRFEIKKRIVHLEPKEKMIERLGRSPDRADVVAMAWYKGAKAFTHASLWRAAGEQGRGKQRPQIVLGHQAARRKRR